MGASSGIGLSESRKRRNVKENTDESHDFEQRRPPQPLPLLHGDQSWKVVVDGSLTVPALLKNGFTKPRVRGCLLPYHAELDKWISTSLEHLESGVLCSILVNEPVPALNNFTIFLIDFVERYGLRFKKDHHIRLIKLYYLILTKEGQWFEVVKLASSLLEKLITSSRLTRKDVVLDWKPVYHLYFNAKYGKLEDIDTEKLGTAVVKMKRFYSLDAQKDIWEQLQVHISPRYSNKTFCDLCVRFLSVNMTAEEHKTYGAGIWWDTLWNLYSMVEMGRLWGENLPYLFCSVHHWAPDFLDRTTFYEELFTLVLRSMGLSLRAGKVAVGDGSGITSMEHFAQWVGDWLGGPNSCEDHLARLMKCLESFLHPSNSGEHQLCILLFMQTLSTHVMARVYLERVKKHKREVPKEYYLSDKDITKFVAIMLEPTLTALYTGDDLKASTKIIMVLASLDPGAVVPKFLEHTYRSLNAVCEPHRLTQTLEALVEVIYQIAADNDPSRKKMKMNVDWFAEMDEVFNMASAVSTYHLTKSNREKVMGQQQERSLRHHLVYLLDVLTVAIDINDVEKTSLSLQNIILILYLVPIVDASGCLEERNDLTEDEKLLCKQSSRLPEIAETLLDKILGIIWKLSVCAPKDSVDLLGGLKDETTKTGDEERTLKREIDRCISAMLEHSSTQISDKLIKKIFDFVRTNQFESSLATEMITGVVAQAVFARPDSWALFAEYVLRELKKILTPEVRKQKDLGSVALWFVNLASGLFCTTSEAYVKNKSICFEIISLLCECDCKIAHETGALGVWFSLYMLTRFYPLQMHSTNALLNRPLKDWVPVREWAKTYQEHEVTMEWHVPDDSRKKVVEEILERFMFPLIEQLKNRNIDTFQLRKALYHLSMAFNGAYVCLPMPESAKGNPVNPGPSVLPSAKLGPSRIPHVNWDIQYNGQNVREVLASVLEDVIKRLASSKDDSQSLITISSFLRSLIDTKMIDHGELTALHQLSSEVFPFLTDPVNYGKRSTMSSLENQLYLSHLTILCREQSLPYSEFHHRVMKVITKLCVNDYPGVRANALAELKELTGEHPQAREPLIPVIVEVMLDPKSSEEALKGALFLVNEAKWAIASNVASRKLLWNALVSMVMVDRPIFSDLMEAIWSQIGKITTPDRNDKPSPELDDFALQWWSEMPHNGVWANFVTETQLATAKETRITVREQRKKEHAELVSMLLALNASKDLHHTRSKLCRTMLWRSQRHKANASTIRVLLSRFADDEEYLRDRCADELSYWMKKNKPKTIRIDWKCPERPADTPKLLCGLRPDNLCVAYDSTNLPDTEEKWNKMVFFTRQYGCYKWPKTISVVAPASDKLLDRKEISEAEGEIIQWFEEKKNVDRWVNFLLIEKNEDETINDNTWWMVKYLLRNFPASEKIFENLTSTLSELLKSKTRAEQRLAGELFVGVAKGTKYRTFHVLEKMWKWLAPEVDHLYDNLLSDAENTWLQTIPLILQKEDHRRFWWLVEQLLSGMMRPAPSARIQAVRADLINSNNWRYTETRKRICEIAWRQLPSAMFETQRFGVSTALKHICTVTDSNMFNDLSQMPERFRLRGTDFWLNRFEEKLGLLKNRFPQASVVASASDTRLCMMDQTAVKPTSKRPRRISRQRSETELDTEDDKQRMHLIYLRTLLEFLLQYYEDCMTCLTPGIIKLFPFIVDYANEDESEDQSTVQNIDIQQSSSLLIHDYMSSLLLKEQYADDFLNTIIHTYSRTVVWRVKVSVLKYLQVIIYSNVFVCEHKNRPIKIRSLLFSAIVDPQNEVRQEAAKCMITLIHCDYLKLDNCLVTQLIQLKESSCQRTRHGAILALGAVLMAFPYSTPPSLVPIIEQLCTVTSKETDLHVAATAALREFRRSHREEWIETARILGPNLVYQIENATAPVYYV